MTGKLLSLVRVEDGVAWRLDRGRRYALGRDMCNHFVANSSSVSDRHLELWVEGDWVMLEDSGLAKRTLVDGATLDGEVRAAKPGTRVETGTVAWRISADEPDPRPAQAFAAPSARARLIEGAKQKQPYRRWTRGWKDLHGRPLAGLLGPDGGAFWFRVFARDLTWSDDPVAVYTSLADDDLTAPVSLDEARAVMSGRRIVAAADAPIAFTLAEMFGPHDALDMIRHANARVLNWLGPFPQTDVLRLIQGLRDPDEVMAVALNAHMPLDGLRRVRQLRPHQDWEVERRLIACNLTPTQIFSLSEELDLRMSGQLVAHLVEQGSDDLIETLHEAVVAGRTSARLPALAERRMPRFAAAALRRHVRGLRADDPYTPVPPDVIEFCECGGGVATKVLVEAFEEMPEHVAETFAMMSDAHLSQVWPNLPPAIRDLIMKRFGPPTADLPELAKSDRTPWMKGCAKTEMKSDWTVYFEDGPRMVTQDGLRLPVAVERGLFAALENSEFSVSHFHYDERLLQAHHDVEPRSALRSMWWQLSRQREPDRHMYRRILHAGASLLLDDRGLVEVTHNTRDMAEHELMVSNAPIVPLLLWIHGWKDCKRVPDAVQPPPEWADELDPDDAVYYEEWPKGMFEELSAEERTPAPNYWDIPTDLEVDDWSRFTRWMLEHLPQSLPENADDLARVWLRAHAVDRTLFDPQRWHWLVENTWLRDIREELVWVAVSPNERRVFRIDAGELVDVEGDLVELPPDASLHLAHPMDLDLRERRDWAQHFAEHRMMTRFDQLDMTGLRDAPSLDRLLGTEARSWGMDDWRTDFHGDVTARDCDLSRDFGSRGRAIARVRGGAIVSIRFEDAVGDSVEPSGLDPVVLSQTVADFEYAITRWQR